MERAGLWVARCFAAETTVKPELEAEELIVIEPHRGAFVRAFTAQDVREIYSYRSLLETAMVNLAQVRVQPADLDL